MSLNQLRERLIFGTGRLAGGGYSGQSCDMIAACHAAGIIRFDTAPVYGMGAAEGLLGTAAGADAILHTKVGSARPGSPALRGWAKRMRNLLPNRASAARLELAPQRYAGPSAAMDFSAETIVGSLDRSRRLLRRDRLDLVLLHEAEPWQIPPESLAVLERQRADGSSAQLGFAHSGPPLRDSAGWAVQTAPWLGDLDAAGLQPRIFHSVLRGLTAAAEGDPVCAAELEASAGELDVADEGPAGRYLAALVWLHRRRPDAGLIFATSAPDRLARFLILLDRIAPPR
jgi:hypothetical protein